MSVQRSKLHRIGLSFTAVALSLYLPFSWLVLVNDPWSDYRLFWLKLWPVLPGILPGAWLFHGHDALEFTAMGVVTAALLAGLSWLGALGRYHLLIAVMIAVLVSVPSAMSAYAAFWT